MARLPTLGLVVGLAAIASSPICASAQQSDSAALPRHAAVLRGRVVQQTDGKPIAGADVWLITIDRHITTDSTGAFRVADLVPTKQLVEVRHVGYDVQRDTVQLSADHENVRTYALAKQSDVLDTVHTVAMQGKYISRRMQSFEERRLSKQGGFFVSDSVFRQNENSTLGNLLQSRIPGVSLLKGTTLVSGRKHCRGLVILGAANSDCKNTGNSDCYVSIYLDGTVYFTARMADQGVKPPDLSRAFDVTSLSGAEFYPDGGSAPAGMHTDDDGCGSLWLWTRER